MNVDSIIFDLDGTLWHSTEGVLKAWSNTFKAHKEFKNPIALEELKSTMGLQLREFGYKLFLYMDKQHQLQFL